MNVIFMGTPEFGVPILNSILSSRHKVIAVVCQPDRAGNRGVVTKPPVKQCAEMNGIKVLQYDRISREGVDTLRELKPDIMVTAAFGQILSDEVLKLAPHGVINVHASLLPLYRGSAPIHYAIIHGEKETGITIMQTAKAVDSGDIILQKKLNILDEETTGELTLRLGVLGAEMIVEALDIIEAGKAIRVPQDHSKSTHYPMLKKENGRINYNKTPLELTNFVRGMNPWPSAYTTIDNGIVKIIKASMVGCTYSGMVGEIVESNARRGLIIVVKGGCLRLDVIQPEGKKVMSDKDYLLGHPILKGTILC